MLLPHLKWTISSQTLLLNRWIHVALTARAKTIKTSVRKSRSLLPEQTISNSILSSKTTQSIIKLNTVTRSHPNRCKWIKHRFKTDFRSLNRQNLRRTTSVASRWCPFQPINRGQSHLTTSWKAQVGTKLNWWLDLKGFLLYKKSQLRITTES